MSGRRPRGRYAPTGQDMLTFTKSDTLAEIRRIGLIAVLRAPSEELALGMVDALVAGGVTGIEITYSTPNAPEVVRNLDQVHGSRILLGMGTLTRPEQVAEARSAGARFIVSPHTKTTLAEAMVASGLVAMLGALTPTEVEQAHAFGADVVKIFPASLGGPAYMRSLRGPFPDIPMMPSGGVSPANVGDWLAAGAVALSAGSELCPVDWARQGRFDAIAERARTFVTALGEARSRIA
jgi:2-dehydro-3-deoxyphosphogluconate aldolase / (4S)-4-hydroxy-2-oxoglutarate aldolase